MPRFEVIERFPVGAQATIAADLSEALVFPKQG